MKLTHSSEQIGIKDGQAFNPAVALFRGLPESLMCDSRFSQVDRAVALHLFLFANRKTGTAWPCVDTLAFRTSYSRRAVFKALSALKDRGVISAVGRRPRKGQGRYVVEYAFLWRESYRQDLAGTPELVDAKPQAAAAEAVGIEVEATPSIPNAAPKGSAEEVARGARRSGAPGAPDLIEDSGYLSEEAAADARARPEAKASGAAAAWPRTEKALQEHGWSTGNGAWAAKCEDLRKEHGASDEIAREVPAVERGERTHRQPAYSPSGIVIRAVDRIRKRRPSGASCASAALDPAIAERLWRAYSTSDEGAKERLDGLRAAEIEPYLQHADLKVRDGADLHLRALRLAGAA